MPNINAHLVHVPRPAPRRGDGARKAAGAAKDKATKFGGKAKTKAQNTYWNATSEGVNPAPKVERPKKTMPFEIGYLSGLGGVGAGYAAGAGVHAVTKPKDKVNKAMPKLKRVPLITDKGTRAERVEYRQMKQDAKRWPKFPGKIAGASFVGGGALGYTSARQTKKLDDEIAQARKKTPVTKSDPFGISKAYDPEKSLRSQGLAFADKKARKRTTKDFQHGYNRDVRAFRTDPKEKKQTHKEIGVGAGIGGALGVGIANASKYRSMSRGKASALAGAGGAAIGATYGTLPSSMRTNKYAFGTAMPANQKRSVKEGQKRGDVVRIKDKSQAGAWSQTVKKSGTVSAFGIEHA